jgi:hypothetical protein
MSKVQEIRYRTLVFYIKDDDIPGGCRGPIFRSSLCRLQSAESDPQRLHAPRCGVSRCPSIMIMMCICVVGSPARRFSGGQLSESVRLEAWPGPMSHRRSPGGAGRSVVLAGAVDRPNAKFDIVRNVLSLRSRWIHCNSSWDSHQSGPSHTRNASLIMDSREAVRYPNGNTGHGCEYRTFP